MSHVSRSRIGLGGGLCESRKWVTKVGHVSWSRKGHGDATECVMNK